MGAPWTAGQRYRWSGSFVHYEEEKHQDNEGNPLWNTAEQPYSLRVPRSYPTIIVSWFYNRINESLRAECVGRAVNENTLWGFEPKMVRLYRWDVKYLQRKWNAGTVGVPAYVNEIFVWNELEFEINHDTYVVDHHEFGTQTLDDSQAVNPETRYEHFTLDGTHGDSVIVPATPIKLSMSGGFAGGDPPRVTPTEPFFLFDFNRLMDTGSDDVKLPSTTPVLA